MLAEGYATAVSLHEATGCPVAVAFDAGNLAGVAKALRQCYPAALLVLCGDDDRATEARTGRVKAEAAARSVSGFTAVPEGLPEGASDFNDMHRAHGLDAVRGTVEGAIAAALQAPQAPAPAPAPTRAAKPRQRPDTGP